MPYTLTLKIDNDADLQLFLELARRMGVKTTAVPVMKARSEAEREESFFKLFGAWKSDESGEEMLRRMNEGRYDESGDLDSQAPAL